MRVLLLAAVALLVAAAPAADATCHFCAEQVQDACATEGAQADECAGAVAYMGTHYVQHLVNDEP